MSDLGAARAQMGTSLGFHIVFAVLGMGLPLLLVIAEGIWLRTGNPVYLALAKRWSKGLAILFAVGAVSGTILSFELGLLWPRFMGSPAASSGCPFSAEGFAFFLEANLPRSLPLRVGPALPARPLAVRHPDRHQRHRLRHLRRLRQCLDEQPGRLQGRQRRGDRRRSRWRPCSTAPGSSRALHMTLAAFVATGFGVAGLYAWGILRGHDDAYHRAGLTIAMALAAIVAPLQAVSGDISAHWVAENQPIKLAALEGQFATEQGAPLRIGGIPDPTTRETRYALELPGLLSLLAYHTTDATVRGLDSWPLSDQPDPRPVHLAFQLMVGIGTALIGLGGWFWFTVRRRRGKPLGPWLLRAVAAATPLGFVAIEAGWTVTEVGRQPWIVYGVMRTSQAVTEVPGQFAAFGGFTATYAVLAVFTAWLLLRLGRTPPTIGEAAVRPEPEPRTGRDRRVPA